MAHEFGLYLDHQHPRPVRGGKTKVKWQDSYGNSHDLDYVLEDGGTEERLGHPRAFIEIAWRKYTKHSRNKVQEIQSAVLPLAETHRHTAPFLGAVLAGDFTESARDQLRSHGFHVAYASYGMILQAFRNVGVDVSSDEASPVAELRRKVRSYEALPAHDRQTISAEIARVCASEFDPFFQSLRNCLERRVTQVAVLALSGTSVRFEAINGAIHFIEGYDEATPASRFDHYELTVRYSNGREVRGSFPDKQDCVSFLGLLGRAG